MIKRAIDQGKRVSLPKTIQEERKLVPIQITSLEDDLEKGLYGILQPKELTNNSIPLEDIDTVIVPGVAFDHDHNRLGRGGGYYDRFLKEIPTGIPSIGLAFDFQIVDFLPISEHDVPVSKVLTN